MKLLILTLAFVLGLCNIQQVQADDPGPLAPCYALLSNGWDILRLRNGGMALEDILTKTVLAAKANNVPDEEIVETLEWIESIWIAPGDGWNWIIKEHQDCLKVTKYGPDQLDPDLTGK